jgi:cytochrome c biogenesis protein ResB
VFGRSWFETRAFPTVKILGSQVISLTETTRWFIHFFDWRFCAIFLSLVGMALILPVSTLKPFRSVRFNVYLFFVIAACASVGTFLPVVYHSWYFASVLALMAFNVVACKLRGLPTGHRRRLKPPSHSKSFTAAIKIEQAFTVLDKLSTNHRWSFVRADDVSGNRIYTASRHGLQRWGDFILHVSVVGILAGNLLGVLRGFEENLAIEEGATARMEHRPYDVSLEDFDIEYYASTGAPSVYASQLVVKKDGVEIGRKRIVVNDPLDIDRVRFYQASWGMTESFRRARLRMAGVSIDLKPNELTPIAGTALSVRANVFYPTFDIDQNGRAVSRDNNGGNPALQIDFLEKKQLRAQMWLLKNHPEAPYQVVGDRVVVASQPPFSLVDVDPILFSGIQVGYDPGAPIFWFFAVTLLIGLCLHFYLHERRIHVVFAPDKQHVRVTVHGWSSRPPQEFAREFENSANDIKAALGE